VRRTQAITGKLCVASNFWLGEELERVKGIEPSSLAWEAKALPLSYTRMPPPFDPENRPAQGSLPLPLAICGMSA
tara:strand:- start:35 stop:259 length:225 start_codon:yes stop_codon:yes gene_type:complete